MTSAQVAQDLYMNDVKTVECSQALDATGAANATVSGTVSQISSGSPSLKILLQGSNDQSMWVDLAGNSSAATVGSLTHMAPIEGYAYVRVRWELTAAASEHIIFSATLNLGL